MQPEHDRDEPGPLDPIALGISDALHYGYQGLGSVADGLRASLTRRPAGDILRRAPAGRVSQEPTRRPLRDDAGRLRATPGAAQPATPQAAEPATPAKPAGKKAKPAKTAAAAKTADPAAETATTAAPESRTAGLLGDLAHLVAEAIDIAGEVAYDLAGVVSGRVPEHDLDGDPDDDHPAEIHANAKPGDKATTQFTLWNTGSLALKDLTFTATTLRAPHGEIDDAAVTFDPAATKHVAPGQSLTVTITIAVPSSQPDGLYRGIVQAEPGGAYTIIELQVGAPK